MCLPGTNDKLTCHSQSMLSIYRQSGTASDWQYTDKENTETQ